MTDDDSGVGPKTRPVDVESLGSPPETKSYIDKVRESMRGLVALGLLFLLAIEVLYGTYKIAELAAEKPEAARTVAHWLGSAITGTIGLLGAATGFYYGSNRN